MTKEEAIEIATQLAFYCGWPKAWSTFPMIVELVSSGNLPKRLPLGSDAVRIIRDELKSRLAEVAVVMSGLIKEGKILHWGISEANEEYLRRAHEVCPVTCIQNRYSMMARWHENFFR